MTMEASTVPLNGTSCPVDRGDNSTSYAVLLTVIAAVGLCGNCVALFAFVFRLKKRNAARCYCINLALADLMYTLTLPLRVVTHVQGGTWPFGDVMCRLSFYIFYMNLYSSIFFLTAISVNRYLAVVRPIQQWQGNSLRAKMVCSGIWIFTGACATPLLIQGTEAASNVCTEPQLDPRVQFVISNLACVLGLMLPLGVIVFCYVSILRRFKLKPADGGSNARSRQGRNKIKALAVVIIVLFMLCFLPYHIVRTTYLYLRMKATGDTASVYCHEADQVNSVLGVMRCLAAGHGCVDPMVYFFYSRHFRSFLNSVLPCKRGVVASRTSKTLLNVRGDAPVATSQVPASQENVDSSTAQDAKPQGARGDRQLTVGDQSQHLQIMENSPSNSCQSFTDY